MKHSAEPPPRPKIPRPVVSPLTSLAGVNEALARTPPDLNGALECAKNLSAYARRPKPAQFTLERLFSVAPLSPYKAQLDTNIAVVESLITQAAYGGDADQAVLGGIAMRLRHVLNREVALAFSDASKLHRKIRTPADLADVAAFVRLFEEQILANGETLGIDLDCLAQSRSSEDPEHRNPRRWLDEAVRNTVQSITHCFALLVRDHDPAASAALGRQMHRFRDVAQFYQWPDFFLPEMFLGTGSPEYWCAVKAAIDATFAACGTDNLAVWLGKCKGVLDVVLYAQLCLYHEAGTVTLPICGVPNLLSKAQAVRVGQALQQRLPEAQRKLAMTWIDGLADLDEAYLGRAEQLVRDARRILNNPNLAYTP